MVKQTRQFNHDDREFIKKVAEYSKLKDDLESLVYGTDSIKDITKAKPRDGVERAQLLEWAGSNILERYKITGLLNEDLGIRETEVCDDDFN